MSEPSDRDYRPISSDAAPWSEFSKGERFASRWRHLTQAVVGGRDNYRVGVLIEELPPGKQSCPFHYHMLDEEHVLILAGELTLRLGEDRHVMTAGDYAVFPAGRKVAHCFVNHGDAVCRYIMIGENHRNEVCVYPDSNKLQVDWLGERYDRAAQRDYWDSEA
jgi:uncharacterized cupin superfamily protein